MKRILALLLILCTCLPFAACGGGNGGTNPGENTSGDYEFIDNVGDHDFGDEEFIISALSAYEREIYKEELEPDAYNQATLTRNQLLEDRFNVKITPIIFTAGDAVAHSSDIRLELMSGNDDTLDMVLMQLWQAGPIVLTQMLYDLRTEVPYVKDVIGQVDYWSAKTNDCYTIYGHQYVGVCDINNSAISVTWAILFNQDMDADYHVAQQIAPNYTTLYDAVDNGTWTIDNMTKIVKDFWIDNPNGANPGTADVDDTYGLISISNSHCREIFTNAFGYDLVINDGVNTPELFTMTNTMVINIGKIQDLFKSRGYNSFTSSDKAWDIRFANGEALLMMCTLSTLDGDTIHESDIKFGVLPYPKADANQKEYYAGTQDAMSTVLAPLNLTTRLEMTGVMIEALAAESHNSVLPAYYEVILKYNATRDEKSVEMIDKIYNGRRYNLSAIHSSSSNELRTPTGGGLAYIFRQITTGTVNAADFWSGQADNFQQRLEILIQDYEDIAALAGG